MNEIVTYARLGFHTSFLESAIFYFKKFELEESQFIIAKQKIKIFETEDYEKQKEIYLRNERFYFNSFIYFSLFLESYIYDYAARRLGDTYVKKYLDKLDAISKWVIIPKLISGKEIDTSRNSFAVLRKVISVRNAYIHFKSFDLTPDNLNRFKSLDEEIKLMDLIVAIKDIFDQLEAIDDGDNHMIYISELSLI